MAINLSDEKESFKELKGHIGHDIVCVCYGTKKNPVNVAIECETCGVVLINIDKPE
jgi:ribosomal protein L25 (general stress protein Ctc)